MSCYGSHYSTLSETEHGAVIHYAEQQRLEFVFNNVSIFLSPSQFFSFKQYVIELDQEEEIFPWSTTVYQVYFQPLPLTLKFNWNEFQEVKELLEAGWVAWELERLMEKAHISYS